VFSSWENERKNEVACRLLHGVAHLHGVPLQFQRLSIDVDIEIKVFVFIPFTIQEKAAPRIPFAKFDFEEFYSLP
jgi:hypothetical protein